MADKRILILEDDPLRIAAFKRRFLEIRDKHPFELDFVDNAQECIEKLSKIKYVLFFADHDLGGEVYVPTDNKNTGSEVARWIKNNPENINKDTIVLVHSYNSQAAITMVEMIPNSLLLPGVWSKDVFARINFGEV